MTRTYPAFECQVRHCKAYIHYEVIRSVQALQSSTIKLLRNPRVEHRSGGLTSMNATGVRLEQTRTFEAGCLLTVWVHAMAA
jgi:hypothetical protein